MWPAPWPPTPRGGGGERQRRHEAPPAPPRVWELDNRSSQAIPVGGRKAPQVKGLREPVSKSQAAILIAAALAYGVSRAAAGPLTAAQFILVLLALEFIVQPLSTLLHELGHAIVARRVSAGPVSVLVGRGPYMSGTIGRVRVNFSMLPGRGVRVRGLCRYEAADVRWRDRAAVSLAGPAATCLELIVGAAMTAAVWSSAGPIARNLLLLATIGLAVSVVINLVPSTIVPGVLANDGANALLALRNHRAGLALATPTRGQAATSEPLMPPPAASPSGSPAPSHPSAAGAQTQSLGPISERERDLARAATSVSPPPKCI